MQPPQELVNLCHTFNKLYKYESNQFQDLSSVYADTIACIS